MTAPQEPPLAAPGAGLPWVELAGTRVFFALLRWTHGLASLDRWFETERAKVRELIRHVTAEAGARRVLIRRPTGLEDSSRNWSVWMTLDHLRRVHIEYVRVISAIGRGVVPDGEVTAAAVKPTADADAGVVTAYEESCDTLRAAVTAAAGSPSPVRFPHPWYGPLTATGWFALAGPHLGAHRIQIERILAGVSKTGG